MFGTILLIIVTIFHLYVFRRIYSIPFIKKYTSSKIIIIIGTSFWILFFSGRFFGHDHTGSLARFVEVIGMNWMGSLFVIFICFLITDLICGFGFLFKKFIPILRITALSAGVLLSIIALIQGYRAPVVEKYEVFIPALPDAMEGKVIVTLSDMHVNSLLDKEWLDERIEQAEKLKPDIIFLLGDIVEGHGTKQNELIPILKQLSAPMGVWFVYGNHESFRNREKIDFMLKESGLKVLKNSWEEISPGLVLAGVDDLSRKARRGIKTDYISETLSNKPDGAVILLSHSPLEMEKAEAHGVNLMLSGHTHGGQIWPFDYIVKTRYPYIEGMHEINGMNLIVSRGTGLWGPRMRLFSPAEISYITLHRQ